MNKKYLQSELKHLKVKAENLIKHGGAAVCKHFFKNEEHGYFQDVMATSGFISPVTKNYGGDPRNPVSGLINGIFLSASHEVHPVPMSGPCRILVNSHELLDRESSLFFSDFYCVQQIHYIQLVLTPGDCLSDYPVISEKLVQLDVSDNRFLWIDGDDNIMVTNEPDVILEVFYTEYINIKDLLQRQDAEFQDMQLPEGVPPPILMKNLECSVCNL